VHINSKEGFLGAIHLGALSQLKVRNGNDLLSSVGRSISVPGLLPEDISGDGLPDLVVSDGGHVRQYVATEAGFPANPTSEINTSVFAKDIVDTAVANGNFKTLVTALTAAGLVDTLKGPGPFTVFAPTDEAFAKIPEADLKALLKDKAQLSAVLTYHVVAGKVMATDVKTGKVKTVQGSELNISVNTTKKPYSESVVTVKVDNSTVIITDIVADNGVIHVIDTVVIPK
jgi:uncharacterized surface protein with fasciclin (FAS1) repeats